MVFPEGNKFARANAETKEKANVAINALNDISSTNSKLAI
jgi:hypothetical protein